MLETVMLAASERKRHIDRGYTPCITNETQPKWHARTQVSAADNVARHLYHHPLVFRHLTDDIDRLHHKYWVCYAIP